MEALEVKQMDVLYAVLKVINLVRSLASVVFNVDSHVCS